jgi:hypothetical protein
VVVPNQLVDLLAVLAVLDELDYRGGGQLRTLMLLSQTTYSSPSMMALPVWPYRLRWGIDGSFVPKLACSFRNTFFLIG